MGFGLLLCGYIFAFVANVGLGDYVFAGMLLGGFLMFLGLCELRKYCPTFLYALIANVLLLLCAFYETIAWAELQLGLSVGFCEPVVLKAFDFIEFGVNLIFNISMLYGIADISRRVEYPQTREKAFRNMIFVGVFNVLQLLMMLPISIFDSDKSFFMTLLMILQVIYTVFNALLIFKCYAMICPAGQEDMQRKKSRFAFINKWHEVQDEREEKAIESTKTYFEDKLRARQEKLNSKNNNNQHNKKKRKK